MPILQLHLTMPKVSSAGDKLTLKFVLLITDGSDSFGRNNDKDSVTVIVKQEHSLSHMVDSSSSTNNNKDSAPSRAEDKPHANDDQVVDNNDGGKNKNNDNGKSEVDSSPQQDSVAPIESTHADTNNSDTSSN